MVCVKPKIKPSGGFYMSLLWKFWPGPKKGGGVKSIPEGEDFSWEGDADFGQDRGCYSQKESYTLTWQILERWVQIWRIVGCWWSPLRQSCSLGSSSVGPLRTNRSGLWQPEWVAQPNKPSQNSAKKPSPCIQISVYREQRCDYEWNE